MTLSVRNMMSLRQVKLRTASSRTGTNMKGIQEGNVRSRHVHQEICNLDERNPLGVIVIALLAFPIAREITVLTSRFPERHH